MTASPRQVTLIPGDGIGPDITDATVRLLEAAGAPLTWDRQVAGMAAVKAHGDPLPEATLESIRRTTLALKGPLETPVGKGFRSINVALRKEFDLYANLRPAKSVLPGNRFQDVDVILVRENTEGLYVGIENYVKVGDDPHAIAQSVAVVTRNGAERIVRYAFEHAVRHGRKRVTLVHKANILKYSQGLFLETGRKVAAEYEGRVAFDDKIVDACAMELVMRPERFDVIVTTNLYGDILSDIAAELTGSVGLAGSAN
ncbi:MAG: isocitrate/isopropylmalate dehydrogenase family protein, partial [Gemmatimonadota bacterium]